MKKKVVGILLILFSFSIEAAQKTNLFSDSNCTIIYALNSNADNYFSNEATQLQNLLINRQIRLIDLNNWRKKPPHIEISGRLRNQIRSMYDLPNNSNQVAVINSYGQILARHVGSVTLINALLDCP